MNKLFAVITGALASAGLAGMIQPPPPPEGGPPPPKAKKEKGEPKTKKEKGEPGPAGDLRRAYDLLRRLRSDMTSSGRSEERLHDWTDRATRLYREGVRAAKDRDWRLAHEYGAAAHDLARAVEHARNAERFDRSDPDLPPPPEGLGPEGERERLRRDLHRAYDRIREGRDRKPAPEGRFYLDAARDFYNAARQDAVADRTDRAAELARAAEALTHVAEHLGHAADRGPGDRRDSEPPPSPPRDRDRDLPPPLDS